MNVNNNAAIANKIVKSYEQTLLAGGVNRRLRGVLRGLPGPFGRDSAATRVRRIPDAVMQASMTSPFQKHGRLPNHPTPLGVPVAMTSRGSQGERL